MPAGARTQEQAAKPVLYVVATSHLDSQWNWTVQDSIRRFVPATFFENFDRFEAFPDYVFSYEGAIHYMWFKEYYPEAWSRVQQYVAKGRWRIAGNWINAVDVNVPAPESLMRHALYAKRFFRAEFGKVSTDVYLPDCFGFGFALPSIARHSGLNAFTTQKLTWGSSYGIPFPVGRWKGVDGSEVIAALDPGAYVTQIESDISTDPKWRNDPTPLGNGRAVIYRLFGVGDVGGAPQAASVDWLAKSLANKNGAVEVRNTSVDQLANDLTPQEKAALPVYEGELTMKTHGVGTHSSQAAMKMLNRANELLADAAERASVAAEWLTGLEYPAARLREAWTRVLWHHFHDDITGTSIPQAYQFSWNDEFVSLNQFGGVLTSATSSVSSLLDTRAQGFPSSSTTRWRSTAWMWWKLTSRCLRWDRSPRCSFASSIEQPDAKFPPKCHGTPAGRGSRFSRTCHPWVSRCSTCETEPDTTTSEAPVFASPRRRWRTAATASISTRMATSHPYSTRKRSASCSSLRFVSRCATTPRRTSRRGAFSMKPSPRLCASTRRSPSSASSSAGPVRVALEITRQAGPSTIVQRVMLTAGGDRVDVQNDIDWKSTNTLLKAAFPFASSNPKATYDLGLGTIQRGNNHADAYEVPGQWWADLTDTSGTLAWPCSMTASTAGTSRPTTFCA
jgi:alpha-mannosidase